MKETEEYKVCNHCVYLITRRDDNTEMSDALFILFGTDDPHRVVQTIKAILVPESTEDVPPLGSTTERRPDTTHHHPWPGVVPVHG